MLPDPLCQLLTAYVDGELSARQLRAVQQLLQRSEEARQFVQQLQSDADQLRQLPRRKPANDLAPQVLLAITDKGLHPVHRPRVHTSSAIPPWLGLATAASVLLVIFAASYLYFVASSAHTPTPAVAASNPTSAEEQAQPPSVRARDSVPVPETERLPAPQPYSLVQNATPIPEPQEVPSVVPTPEGNLESILTTPNPRMELFPQIADTKLALILSLAQLDQSSPPRELADELRKDTAYRIELACLEGGKAMDRLRAAFQAQGIRLVIDHVAQDRLKLKLRTSYALYVENITPDEVAKVLRHLSVEDKKSRPRRQFDQVVLQRMTQEDHQEVSKLLGVAEKASSTTRTKSPLEVNLHQPLSTTTAEQVEQTLKGQGGRPTPAKPVAKPGERLAVVVPYNPVRPRAASPQVKLFLESRKERLPNTLQLVLVLRGNNG